MVNGSGIMPKTDILEAEEVVAGGVRGTSVFARAEEEVICKDKAVSNGVCSGSALGYGEVMRQGKHGEGEGLDAGGRSVRALPRAKMGGKAKVKVAKVV